LPIAVEVFEGNTADPTTPEIARLRSWKSRFGIKRVVLIRDRGMITTARIARISNLPAWTGLRACARRRFKRGQRPWPLQLSLSMSGSGGDQLA